MKIVQDSEGPMRMQEISQPRRDWPAARSGGTTTRGAAGQSISVGIGTQSTLECPLFLLKSSSPKNYGYWDDIRRSI